MKPKNKRLIIFIISILMIITGVTIIIKQFEDNITFFVTPQQINNKHFYKIIRVGGLVKAGSVNKNINNSMKHQFIVTDNNTDLMIEYDGLLPNLFREEQGVVAKGVYDPDKKLFIAEEILAKHDEKYIPKEIYQQLHNKQDSVD